MGRQQKLLEEQRRRREYLLELERERYEREQEKQNQRRQYFALLEQQRLQEERKERARAAACKARKRNQNQNQTKRIINHTRPQPMHQFVRMPNGSLYIVSNAPNSVHDEAYPSKGHTLSNNIEASDLLEEANAALEPSQARKFLYTNSSCATGMRQPLESSFRRSTC